MAHASARIRRVVVGVVVATTIASYAGTALAPYLLIEHPLILLLLAPVGRHVALAAPTTALLPLAAVVVVRRVLSLWAAWAVGAIYGPAATDWVEKRSARAGGYVRFVERIFERWGQPLLLIVPTHLLCGLAGAAGTRALVMLVLATIGELCWTLGAYYFGSAISDFTRPVLAFLAAHLLEATLVSLGAVLLYRLFSRRRRTPRSV